MGKWKRFHNVNQSPAKAAFTLVEMAIALIVIGVVLSAVLPLLRVHGEQTRIATTREHQQRIVRALVAFLHEDWRLPCPARADAMTAGLEAAGCAADPGLLEGVVPYRTLGLPAEVARDGWHRPMTYRVHAALADPDSLGNRDDYCAETPDPAGLSVDGPGGEVPAFALVSHGGNGLGAFTSAGARVSGAGGDEAENADGDAYFVTAGHRR